MAVIENINVSSPNDGLGDSLRDSQIKANTNFAELNDKKVEKVAGKDLSANNFTDLLKTKLDGIEDGAEVNVQPDWSQTDNLADDYIKNKPDLSQYFSAVGGFDYNHSIATPVAYTSGNLQLENDGLGAFTQTNLAPYGITQVWDSTTNTFNFGELAIGDEVLLRVHLRLTTSVNNQVSGLSLLFGEGTTSEYTLPVDTQMYFKDSGNHDVMKEISFYIGNEDWRVTPVKLLFNSSANASVLVYGWHPYIIRKSVNILDINDDNYKTFSILGIVSNSTVNSVSDGGISVGYNLATNKINRVVFDISYSKYIYNYDQIKTLYDFNLNWFDKDSQRTYVSFISGFTAVGSHYILDVEETLNYNDFLLNDKIEVFINATKKTDLTIIDDGITSLNKTWSSSKLDGILDLKADLVAGKVPASQLPSYVDDVEEYANLGAFPITGETGKIYIALDTNKTYRWSGSVYVNMTDATIPSLQEVTDIGSTTTNSMTANSFIKSGGTASQFLKADGSVDTNIYWSLQGNNAISTNFLGTTNNLDLNFRRNNINAGKIQANNTTLGVNSGQNLDPSNAVNNTAIGRESLLANVISDNNTAIGSGSLYGATNSNNTAVGAFSLGDQTNGSNNTALGYNAGKNHNGSNNIFIGKDCALGVLGAGTNNIIIGVGANFVGGGALSNQINIGDFLYKSSTGNFGIDISTPTAKLDINGSTRLRGTLLDTNNQSGTSGQVLSSTGTGVDWIDAPSMVSYIGANADFDFLIETKEVILTILNAQITNANLKAVSFIPIETTETSLDDFSLNGLRFNIENIIDGVSFDIRAIAEQEANGIYRVKYLITI
jgi:hypothetical protein